jgi:4-aminobutyrate aminotransferase-like enzyme
MTNISIDIYKRKVFYVWRMKYKLVLVVRVHISGHFNPMKKVCILLSIDHTFIHLFHADIVPDFVTMGKSMGNGFPVSALMTRREITHRFDINGVEYFNTYGGNPVSCRAAIAVMDIIDKENLIEHARIVGKYLLDKFKALAQSYDMIGDVRGRGLFLGIELVRDVKTRAPASDEARAIKYR